MIAPALFSLLAAAPVITPAAPTAPAFTLKTRPYDAQHYRLEVRLGDDGAYKNKLTATLKAGKALPVIELDAYGLAFETAVVDGEAADFKVAADAASRTGTVTVKPKRPIAAGKTTVVELTYSGRAETSTGFFTATDDRGRQRCCLATSPTLSRNAAQRFMPVNDTPATRPRAKFWRSSTRGTRSFPTVGKNWTRCSPKTARICAGCTGSRSKAPLAPT